MVLPVNPSFTKSISVSLTDCTKLLPWKETVSVFAKSITLFGKTFFVFLMFFSNLDAPTFKLSCFNNISVSFCLITVSMFCFRLGTFKVSELREVSMWEDILANTSNSQWWWYGCTLGSTGQTSFSVSQNEVCCRRLLSFIGIFFLNTRYRVATNLENP